MTEYLDPNKPLYGRVSSYENNRGVITAYDNRDPLPFSGRDQLDNQIIRVGKEVQYTLDQELNGRTKAINISVLNAHGVPFPPVPKVKRQNLQCEKCHATGHVKEDCGVDPERKWTTVTKFKKGNSRAYKGGRR